MNLLFLDIDGVLNSIEFSGDIDPKAITRLNQIVAATDAKIVISSYWRICLGYEQTCRRLIKAGLEAEIVGETSALDGSGENRAIEIQDFLDNNPAERFVILDDCSLYPTHIGPLNEHLVRTDFFTGLTDEDVLSAVCILRR